jgi:UDP-GlcNAc:undecaprenyl-phosphate GlcNAc-1-phosphate transferase
MLIFYFILLIILNFILFRYNSIIATKFNIFDSPNKIRKFHKNKTPITGGLIVFFNIFFFSIFYLADSFKDFTLFEDKFEFIIFLLSSLLIFCVGLLDDKYDISANKKFVFILLILIPTIFFQDYLIIENINVSFLTHQYHIGYTGFFWSLLCFLLFINAINMFDGINLQVGLYSLIVLTFFIFNNYHLIFFITLYLSIVTFLILNSKSKSFLGDGGSYLLAYIIGYFFIKLYNETEALKADQVVLFMILPGLDLMRLFISRILVKKNPFSSDRNHLHHLLLKKYSYIKTVGIIQIMLITPPVIGIFYNNYLIILLFFFVTYSFIVSKLK